MKKKEGAGRIRLAVGRHRNSRPGARYRPLRLYCGQFGNIWRLLRAGDDQAVWDPVINQSD